MKKIIFILALSIFTQTTYSQDVAINEFIYSDSTNYDWIEIYNFGNNPINLKNFHLTDNADSLFKWTFPNKTLWPKEFLIIFASKKNGTDSLGNLHTNFKLKSTDKTIILSSPSGKIIDQVNLPPLQKNHSLGRYPNGVGNFKFYSIPTPNSRNSFNYTAEYVDTPKISHQSGFYTKSFYLKIQHSDPEITIHYTLDGSEPTILSPVFTDSLYIYNHSNQKNVFSAIPTTKKENEWYNWKPPIGKVFKCTNIKIKAFKGTSSSKTIIKTYFISDDILYKYTIPVISLSINVHDLFSDKGIFTNFDSTGKKWEIPAHIDYFEPNGTLGFSANIGIRTHGANTRKYSQKSLRLYFRKKYGTEKLEYQIFKDNKVKVFKKIILRNGGSDWSKFFMRDAFAQNFLTEYSNLPHQSYQPVLVFINGEFSGLMNIREYYDKTYFEQHYNCKKFDLIREPKTRIIYGKNIDFLKMLEFVDTNDLSLDTNYKYITNLIDIDNYIDYQILQIFIMNTDQPGKNVFYWRPKNGKWQWLLYDLDDCLNFGDHNNYNKNGLIFCSGLNSINSANINPKSSFPIWANNTPKETLLFRKLLKNINFKNKFINRFADLLNSAFEPDVLEKKLNTYYSVIYKYMPEQYQRWQKPDPLIFENNYNLILEFIKNRKDIQTKQILDFFKINKTITINLQINEPKYGYIKINTLNINDTLLIKNKNQDTWEGLYFYNIPIEIEAIPYSGYFFERWELDTNSNNPKILFLSTSNLKIKAVFALNNNS